MMKLEGMGIFARVAEAKSFSGAARRLGISKSLVSKEVSKLEKALGARLLNRTTRQLSLTEFGAAFYEHCARVVQEAEEAELLVERLHSSPRGVLKCTAPVAFATLHIARAIPPNMVARPIAPINRVICGTPEYFAARGIPRTPQQLSDHDCVIYTHANPDSVWHLSANGADIAVPVRGALKVNDDEVAWQAVRAGLGLSLLPTFIVGDDLQSGRLQAVLTEYLPSERNLYALYLPNRHLSAKVRVFIDFMLSKYSPPPYWDRDWVSGSTARDAAAASGQSDAKHARSRSAAPRAGQRTSSRTRSA